VGTVRFDSRIIRELKAIESCWINQLKKKALGLLAIDDKSNRKLQAHATK